MKIVRNCPQELEDEAIAHYRMSDQPVFAPDRLMKLTSEERQSAKWASHWMSLFWYVFGYAQAKGYKTPLQSSEKNAA